MINKIIAHGRNTGCSDIHLTEGEPIAFRKCGKIFIDKTFDTNEYDVSKLVKAMLNHQNEDEIKSRIDLDFCYTNDSGERQRVNVYYHQDKVCAAIRLLQNSTPTLQELNLPDAITELASKPHGLVLVTGPTGSGKSTTLAAMIDHINRTRNCHIITIEDPVEYLHTGGNSLVHQREVGSDTQSFSSALRSSLREDPDVILVGEMRDLETISAAVTAAETGHLVLSTLHTTGAANTIDRIIDVFSEGDKDQIRTQLSTVLRGVVTQQLIPTIDGDGRCAAFEILLSNDAVGNLIREKKCFQINTILQTNVKEGMCTLDYDLARLVKLGKISIYDALERVTDQKQFMRTLQ